MTHGGDIPLPGFEALAAPASAPRVRPFTIAIVRSARRKRSISAELNDGVLTVTAPTWMSRSDVEEAAKSFAQRFEQRERCASVDLASRAASLARRYRLPKPSSIRWSATMARQWGSCTVGDRSIRISETVAEFPPWVLDYVIVHELSHLECAEHSQEFWALVARYPKSERARGYLLAKSTD
jgi:predicted metal-dependent hydrolase